MCISGLRHVTPRFLLTLGARVVSLIFRRHLGVLVRALRVLSDSHCLPFNLFIVLPCTREKTIIVAPQRSLSAFQHRHSIIEEP